LISKRPPAPAPPAGCLRSGAPVVILYAMGASTRTAVMALAAFMLVSTVAGCTRPAARTASHSPPGGTVIRRLGAPGCDPPSPVSASPIGGRQVEGTGHGAELWGLLFFAHSPRAGHQVKIVWRMTGNGPLKLTATGPGQRHLRPAWGPEPHGGSNWDKPGKEWGSAFDFTAPGCWDLHATREEASADIWIQVIT
jgi:hypothetical protein